MHFDETSAECLVYTYAEGVLSALVHDLKLRVGRFTIDVDDGDGAVVAWFDAASLRVVAAVREGCDDTAALGDADRRRIEATIAETVLEVGRHPGIRFTSTAVTGQGTWFQVAGRLALHGCERRIVVPVRPDPPAGLVAEIRLHKPDFGIRPYRALFGALQVKPDVRVRVRVLAGEARARIDAERPVAT